MPEDKEYDGSTMLKSVMQEAFVTNILAGLPQYEAYQKAGYNGKNEGILRSNATHALTTNNNIKARLAYKRAELAKKVEITEQTQVKRLQVLSELAQKLNQVSAAVSAEDRINTLLGLYSKDNQQKGPRTLVEILAVVADKTNILCLEAKNDDMGVLEAGNVQTEGSK